MPHHHQQAHSSSEGTLDHHRLPKDTCPTAYHIHLTPQPSQHIFQGVVIIHINQRHKDPKDVKFESLTLHALRLSIEDIVLATDATLLDLHTEPVLNEENKHLMFRPTMTTPDQEREMITWQFPPEAVPASSSNTAVDSDVVSFAVRIRYQGFIQSKTTAPRDGLVGIFHSESQTDENFLSVLSEPTHARCVFPCFDEPAFKTPMTLSVDFDSAYDVIGPTSVASQTMISMSQDTPLQATRLSSPGTVNSNPTPTFSTSPVNNTSTTSTNLNFNSASGGVRRTVFEPTPPLSSYLLAFTVGKFQILQQSTKRGLLCRILSPQHEMQHEAWYALHLLVKAVEFFEDFFQFELQTAKLDIVAITDLQVLGMENWGIISILKDYLLVNETTSIERRQRIARLVAHEVAHQWYGNTISIQWWTQLWLKEGFCRYLEYIFVNDAYPRWFVWCDFIAQILDDALVHDCKVSKTHPVEMSGSLMCKPRRIFEGFDVISYGKGASILRMLAVSVGDDTVRRALQLLCRKFQYDSFERKDFEQCMQDALRQGPGAGLSVADHNPFLHATAAPPTSRSVATPQILDWVSTSGHPLVYVQHHAHRGVISISQFAMPDVVTGILPQLKVSEEAVRAQLATPRQFSLTSSMTPRAKEFIWSMRQVLRPSSHKIPIQAVELLQGQSSVRRTVMLEAPHIVIETHSSTPMTTRSPTSSQSGPTLTATRTPSSHHQRTPSFGVPVETNASLIYFNYTGSGVFRVDYDHSTWLRVMELAPFLTAHDRVTITVTLFRLRTLHIGKIVTDKADEEVMGLPAASSQGFPTVLTTPRPSSSSSAAAAAASSGSATPPSSSNLHLFPPLAPSDSNNSNAASGNHLTSPYCGKIDRREALSVASHGDRCTILLEWLVVIGQQRFTNASLWRTIVEQLDSLLYLLKGVPCWGIFAEFTASLLVPFVEQGRAAFRAREKSVEFQSQNDLSKATVLHMLLLLSMCRCRTIAADAMDTTDWVLAFVSESNHHTGMDAPQAVELSRPVSPTSQPSQSASFAVSHSTANTACSMTATLNQQGAAVLASMQTEFGGQQAGGLRGEDHEVPFDIRNDNDVAVAMVALQCTVESGDSIRWWRAAAILARAVGLDLTTATDPSGIEANGYAPPLLTTEIFNLVGPLPSLDASMCETIDTARHRWINILVPAVFCSDDPLTFPIIRALFGQLTGLSAPLSKALLRNTKLLTYLLESISFAAIPTGVRHALLGLAATCCSNTAIIALLVGDAHINHHNTNVVGGQSPQKQNPLSAPPAVAQAPHPPASASLPLSGAVQKQLERIESNALWVDYVGEHYFRFLREKKSAGQWHNVSTSLMQPLSHSDPPVHADNKPAVGGISI